MKFDTKKIRSFFRRARENASVEIPPSLAQANAKTPFASALAGLCSKGLVAPSVAAPAKPIRHPNSPK